MKNRIKINRLAHKYALDISKFHEKKTTKIDFNNLNKDFYGDIDKNDTIIKLDKKLLNKIKIKALKEFIYTNKIIPDYWKNKLDYQYEMTNLISKDKKLLSYIGSFSTNNQNSLNLPKINNSEMGSLTTKYSDLNDKKKKTFSFKYNEGIKEDNIKSIMDKYNLVYPIKEKLEILTKEHEDLLYNETTKNNISFHDNETNSNQTDNSNQIGVLAKIKAKLKRQGSFRQNLFSLDTLRLKYTNLLSMNNTKTGNNFNKKKFRILDKNIEKNVKSINNYGPYNSFCRLCKIKNIDFYNNLEHNHCLDLINHIKNFRKINKISDLSTIKRSSSVPKLSLFTDKESTESEIKEINLK